MSSFNPTLSNVIIENVTQPTATTRTISHTSDLYSYVVPPTTRTKIYTTDLYPKSTGSVNQANYIVTVWMENVGASSIIGNTSTYPFINKLLNNTATGSTGVINCAYCNNYKACENGVSNPTYHLWQGAEDIDPTTTQGTFNFSGTDTAIPPTYISTNRTLVDNITGSGRTWKGYLEGYEGFNVSLGNTNSSNYLGTYHWYERHCTTLAYQNITGNPINAVLNVNTGPVGGSPDGTVNSQATFNSYYSTFISDYSSLSTTPNWAQISPNGVNDMHDNGGNPGDVYLSYLVPYIMSTPAFTSNQGVLFITWDDGGSTNSIVLFMALGPLAKQGGFAGPTTGPSFTNGEGTSVLPPNQLSYTATIEDIWGLPHLNANDANGTSLRKLLLNV
jgi:hypothetical protein